MCSYETWPANIDRERESWAIVLGNLLDDFKNWVLNPDLFHLSTLQQLIKSQL